METFWTTCKSCHREVQVDWDVEETGYYANCPRCHYITLLCEKCREVGNHRCDKKPRSMYCKRNRTNGETVFNPPMHEACERIMALTFSQDMWNDLLLQHTVYRSEPDRNFNVGVHHEDANRMYDFEDANNAIVYYVIRTRPEYGHVVDYFMFVNKDKSTWNKAWREFDDMVVTVYKDDLQHPENNGFVKIPIERWGDCIKMTASANILSL